MAVVRNCVLPRDLYYKVEEHLWLRVNADGSVTLGLTDAAQTLAGAILYVNPRAVGKMYERNKTIATVESGKWIGVMRAPVAGTLLEANPLVLADAGLINRSPYKQGWIVRLAPTQLEEDLQFLVTGEAALVAYEDFMEQRNLSECIHCEGFEI